MTHFVSLTGQVYINSDHTQSVQPYTEKPRFSDARNCKFFVPTYETRNVLALSNGMELFSSQTTQEIMAAIAESHEQSPHMAASPVAINQHLMVDPSCIVAVFPCDHHFRKYVEEEHACEIYEACDSPNSLIVLDDETCLAVDTTPTELMGKLSTSRQG